MRETVGNYIRQSILRFQISVNEEVSNDQTEKTSHRIYDVGVMTTE